MHHTFGSFRFHHLNHFYLLQCFYHAFRFYCAFQFHRLFYFYFKYRLELCLALLISECRNVHAFVHPSSISPEFAYILGSLVQFRQGFGAAMLRPKNAHLTYFKKNKLSFFQHTDHLKIVRDSVSTKCRLQNAL